MDTHDIYLVPGFFGFANLGEFKYFGHVRAFLKEQFAARGQRARITVVRTHPTASLPRRAVRLLETMAAAPRRRGRVVHLIGHSSGGLDVRLVTTPGVRLPTALDVKQLTDPVRSVITVVTPNHGTPLASLFNSLLGQKLLHVLSVTTIYVLRTGHLPLSVLLRLGAIFTQLDDLALNSAVLDQVFGEVLADFSPGRRRAVSKLFGEVAQDQSLLAQLTPEALDMFNALTHDRPEVRYGCVVAQARRPGIGSTMAAGLDPTAQATHAMYATLHRLAGDIPRGRLPALTRPQACALRSAYGRVPDARANDGLVPTRTQVWGNVVHAARGDHLDVIGHFGAPKHHPPHYDWLATGTGFDTAQFTALWSAVLSYMLAR